MAATARIRANVDPAVKAEATQILAEIGLTPADAIRILLKRVVAEQRLPIALLVPNEVTLEAMREAEEGRLHSADTVEEMLAELQSDDDRIT
jgi:DNA-damage-inducible protein J